MINIQNELSRIASNIDNALVLAELAGQEKIVKPLKDAQETLKSLIGPSDKKEQLETLLRTHNGPSREGVLLHQFPQAQAVPRLN